MGGVRQRNHQVSPDISCKTGEAVVGDGSARSPSPSRMRIFTHASRIRQPSRSPRASPNQGNPYAPEQRSSISLLIYIVLFLSLAVSVLLLQSSTSIPWGIIDNENHNTPRKAWVRSRDNHLSYPTSLYHRVIYFGGNWDPNHVSRKDLALLNEEHEVRVQSVQDDWQPHHEEHCLPKADWQVKSNPNCNTIHEINIAASAGAHNTEESLSVLGEGWFRTTWQLDRPVTEESVVLKTLRIQREFLSEYYELHRRDAVAMERLTASSFVVDIFGFCGQSAINELANFPYPNILNLETFNRRMRGKDSARAFTMKLRMAASIALGVADIHAGGSTDPDDENIYITHYDINPRNIALFAGGRPKINDFNIAEFLRYDPATNKTCKFPSRLHEPWWRAPEEMNTTHTVLVDEKVDIYALGNIIYHTLTTHCGRGKQKKERMAEVRPQVAAGIRPEIPEVYLNSNDTNVVAMVKAIDLCWAKDPEERGSAEEVAAILYEALLNLKGPPATVEEDEMNQPENGQDDDDSGGDNEIEEKDALGHTA